VAAFVTVAAAPEAHAKPKKVNYQNRREAKRLFNQGHLAYRRGDYEEAILKWQESYELSKEPLIFLSIANAYERLGDVKEALSYLKKWREKAPRREHAELDGRIERLEARAQKIEEEERLQREENERRQREENERRQREEELRRQQAEEGVPETKSNPLRTVGFVMVGAGAAAVVAGVVMDIVAGAGRPAEDEVCVDQGGQLLCTDDSRDDIERTDTLAIAGDITWIAGAAIAAGGVAVLLTVGSEEVVPAEDDSASDHSAIEDAQVVPLVGPRGGGVLFTARF
jgi:tetratricopeptide (TPR) repeat protein